MFPEILSKGGTILESSRLPSFKEDKVQEQAIHQLKQKRIDGLVVIGEMEVIKEL